MAILTGVTNIFSTNYYSSSHHTDVSGLTTAQIDASKLGRFYIEFVGSGSGNPSMTQSSILRMGTMDFVDDETQVGTHDQLKDTNWSDFNQSGAHLEPYELIDDGGTVAGVVTYATDNSGESGTEGNWIPAWITAFGVRFDSYVHFLFDRHQIVESEGAETESLFTGPEALKTVDPEARIEILSLFPELVDIDYDRLPDPVRPILSGRQGRKLANRHANNKKYLAQ